MKKFFIIGGIFLAVGAGCIFTQQPIPDETQTQKVEIAATFYPLGYFAKKVGGEYVDVKVITPGGGEPHDYEPTPSDIIAIENSDIFFLNGLGIDSWAENIQATLSQKGIKTLQMSEFIDTLIKSEEHEEEPNEDHEEEEEHGEFDPHFWLDPLIVQKEIDAIEQVLVEVDPIHAAVYTQNASAYKKKLQKLHEEYVLGLSDCKKSEIIVSHNAFSYLAKRYTFDVFSIAGISPEEEPSPFRIKELVQVARAKNIQVIFFETLVSPKLAETLAKEVGAQTAVLNPIEGVTPEEEANGENYDTIMRDNLVHLRTALVCQ